MKKLIRKLATLTEKALVGAFDFTALTVLLPFAYAASLLPDTGREFGDWYATRCRGSWSRLWR